MGRKKKQRRNIRADDKETRCPNRVTLLDEIGNIHFFHCVRWRNHKGSCYAGEIPGYEKKRPSQFKDLKSAATAVKQREFR